MNIWDRRKAGVVATLKRGSCSKAAILSANTTLLPSAAICGEVLVQLRDEGRVAKICVTKHSYRYELIEAFKMPAPKRIPDFVPQVPMYELRRG